MFCDHDRQMVSSKVQGVIMHGIRKGAGLGIQSKSGGVGAKSCSKVSRFYSATPFNARKGKMDALACTQTPLQRNEGVLVVKPGLVM